MRWAALFGDELVEQHDWVQPLRGDWITRLEDVVQNQLKKQPDVPIALVAHSLGCHLVASWAALSPNVGKIAGALLVAPPDPSTFDLMPQLHSWKKPVLNKIPFKTSIVASTRDPFCNVTIAQDLAASWGSRIVDVGPIGHINADSGLADWPAGREMLNQLLNK
jgi:predicted alpha/beta hydrolase family esterase